MTIEEAIKVQKWLGNNHFLFASTFEDVKASTKMAIQSLEAWEKVKQDLYKMATESLDHEYAQCYRIALCCVDGHLKEVSDGNS